MTRIVVLPEFSHREVQIPRRGKRMNALTDARKLDTYPHVLFDVVGIILGCLPLASQSSLLIG